MNLDQRIKAFAILGEYLKNIGEEEFQSLAEGAGNQNPWFTIFSVQMAMKGIGEFLSESALKKWTNSYSPARSERKVALIMAGNIPFVGFHDLLAILISGHSALLKLSSKDQFLMKYLIRKLVEIEPEFNPKIVIAEELMKNFDAVIATGSDNSSRYFEYYFGKYPHIIRKNRTSVGILNGNETVAELNELGKDVFTYFGLGCRNISKLFVPEHYEFIKLLDNWSSYESIIHHYKYCNNYDYQKSILLVNRVPFLDNGFILLQKSDRIVSPISVLYHEGYRNEKDLEEKIAGIRDKIQVIVGNSKLCTVPFGKAQYPRVTDYADNVDTMKFLSELK
jgi:hypothetical protein